MPYSNSGTYVPLGAAVSAVSGDVIRSANWNSIFVDIAAALTAVRISYTQNSSAVTITANYTVSSTDSAIICDGTVGNTTLALPTAATFPGRFLYVKNISTHTLSVVAAATVVQPLIGPTGTVGVTIVGTTVGKWAQLVSNGGSTWIIMAGN